MPPSKSTLYWLSVGKQVNKSCSLVQHRQHSKTYSALAPCVIKSEASHTCQSCFIDVVWPLHSSSDVNGDLECDGNDHLFN